MRNQLISAACQNGLKYLIASCVAGGLAAGLIVNSTASAAAETKIGLILEARPADQPWSAAITDAADKLVKAHPDYKLLVSYKAFDPTAAEPVARQMIQQGAGVIDFHSFALNDVAHNLAKEFPKVVMSVSSFAPPVQPNLNIGTASYYQIGYSQCWLLAKISKAHKIAFVGSMPIPYETEQLKGCELGAAAAYKGTQVLTGYINGFENQQATREQAQALIDRGADVLYPSSATQKLARRLSALRAEEDPVRRLGERNPPLCADLWHHVGGHRLVDLPGTPGRRGGQSRHEGGHVRRDL